MGEMQKATWAELCLLCFVKLLKDRLGVLRIQGFRGIGIVFRVPGLRVWGFTFWVVRCR